MLLSPTLYLILSQSSWQSSVTLLQESIQAWLYAKVTYLQEEEINFSNPAKIFALEINKYQDQLHTQNYREHNWKMSELQLAYDLPLIWF